MIETKVSPGTSDMPLPLIMDYRKMYTVTPLFRKDLETVLADVAYADAAVFFNIIDQHDSVFPAAVLHDFIESLKKLPYKVICPMMKVLENKDNFHKYFKPISDCK